MPFCLLDDSEAIVRQGDIVVQATQADRAAIGQETIHQQIPALLVAYQRIAIIRERQSQYAFTHHVRDAAKRNASLRLAAVVENDISGRLPTISIGEHLDPTRR